MMLSLLYQSHPITFCHSIPTCIFTLSSRDPDSRTHPWITKLSGAILYYTVVLCNISCCPSANHCVGCGCVNICLACLPWKSVYITTISSHNQISSMPAKKNKKKYIIIICPHFKWNTGNQILWRLCTKYKANIINYSCTSLPGMASVHNIFNM